MDRMIKRLMSRAQHEDRDETLDALARRLGKAFPELRELFRAISVVGCRRGGWTAAMDRQVRLLSAYRVEALKSEVRDVRHMTRNNQPELTFVLCFALELGTEIVRSVENVPEAVLDRIEAVLRVHAA